MAQPQIFQDSIEYYQSIIKKAPNNESAWFGLQKSFLHIGDIKFAQQLTKYDLSDRLLWGHIRVLFYAHQFDTIPRFITELATKFPKSPYLNDALELGILITETKSSDADLKIYARAHLDYEIGDYDNAIKDCKQLIVKTNKVSEYAYLLLERIYRAKKEINQSIATLDEFVQRFPESHLNPKARYELGLIYLESLKDTARARTVLEDLITDFPFSIPAFFARAKLAIIDTEGKKESKIK
ncbi:MAG: tetratricopeptide repeat protein [candidate division WOR-3 bacterium]|nr:tetratricopeptide repeat protein [candidate division WOR-3 bacterium]